MAAAHLGPFNVSCTAGPPNVVDLILTPAEVAVVTGRSALTGGPLGGTFGGVGAACVAELKAG